eukprot:scaffold187109_cov22-Tisochrysis_lutea.AAC.1
MRVVTYHQGLSKRNLHLNIRHPNFITHHSSPTINANAQDSRRKSRAGFAMAPGAQARVTHHSRTLPFAL